MTSAIEIRELKTMAELDATVALQRAVWGMRDVEVSSPHTLRAIVHSGGAVFGAMLKGALVGFCFGFAAWRVGSRGHSEVAVSTRHPADTATTPREGELWLWSHMAAAHPDFQGRGIGFRLKQAQRKWALAQGFRRMAWTFDPLQAGNANFNFNRLGVTARHYSADHYGEMQDGLNAGLASDRLEAQWELDAPHVVALAQGRQRGVGPGLAEARPLVWVDAAGALQSHAGTALDQTHFAIEIPPDIAALKQGDVERAKTWQLLVRQAMTTLFDSKYAVTGFERSAGKAWYIVTRES